MASSPSPPSSFIVYLTLIIIMAFMPSPIFSSHPSIPTLSSSPATLKNPPPSSSQPPFQPLSPEIAPLFPSPGSVFPKPSAGSDIPTIPSSPSTSNPDDIVAPGPFPDFSPMHASSNAHRSLVCNTAFAGVAAAAAYYWSMKYIMRV